MITIKKVPPSLNFTIHIFKVEAHTLILLIVMSQVKDTGMMKNMSS